MILPADKGRTTVVMKKEDYHDKLMSLLNDKKFYKVLGKNATPCIERKLNATLLNLKKEDDAIPDQLYCRFISSGGHIPMVYGLPKLHKPETPLRPIVSFVSSPT